MHREHLAMHVLSKHKCACWFEKSILRDECHYHACKRTGRRFNGDPISSIENFKERYPGIPHRIKCYIKTIRHKIWPGVVSFEPKIPKEPIGCCPGSKRNST